MMGLFKCSTLIKQILFFIANSRRKRRHVFFELQIDPHGLRRTPANATQNGQYAGSCQHHATHKRAATKQQQANAHERGADEEPHSVGTVHGLGGEAVARWMDTTSKLLRICCQKYTNTIRGTCNSIVFYLTILRAGTRARKISKKDHPLALATHLPALAWC